MTWILFGIQVRCSGCGARYVFTLRETPIEASPLCMNSGSFPECPECSKPAPPPLRVVKGET